MSQSSKERALLVVDVENGKYFFPSVFFPSRKRNKKASNSDIIVSRKKMATFRLSKLRKDHLKANKRSC